MDEQPKLSGSRFAGIPTAGSVDDTLVVAGLLILVEMLWASGYPEHVKVGIQQRVELIISRVQGRMVDL